MKDLSFLTIQELKSLLAKKEISTQDILQATFSRIESLDPELKAFVEVFGKDSVLEHRHETGGVLQDIPGAIKDNICQQDRITSCGSKMLSNFRSTYNATVIDRLKHAGALMVGRANMDEFAMGSSTETSWYGVTKNPWDTSRVPGGSSGGSAAAVASGMVPWALGSDTGGSVRQPAAFCGITGLKPTYGSVSRYGLVAYASSLDQVGVFARDVYDTATVFSVIAGQDDKDASTLRTSAKDYTQHLDGKIPSGLRIGIIENAFDADGMDPEVQKMMYDVASEYEKMGAQITKIKMPSLDYAAACYFIISRAEAASNLARFDGVKYGYRAPEVKDLQEVYFKSRGQGFGKEVQLRIMVGNYVLTAGHAGKYYHNAKLVQQMMRQNFIDTFKDIDVLLMPTQAAPAFHFNAFAENKLQMDLQDYFTAGLNLAGVPGMSIPCGVTKENLPVGIQLIGTHGSEELLFKVGHAYQQVTDWHTKKPKI
jgi:aspartyl-tRNA(Asn)/glutamyl-tRNA(Gln) amidotransferase subunit A